MTKTHAEKPAERHENIFAALSAFQGELKPLPKSATVKFKTKTGGEVDFKYTPLGEIMEAIYPVLAKHGLSVRHEIRKIEGRDYIEAVLTHETYRVRDLDKVEIRRTKGDLEEETELKDTRQETVGELRSGPVKIYQGDDMKDIGAAITYARRYSLTMLLGISSEDDTDAKLFMERAEAAMGFAYTRAKKSVEEAKTAKDIDKALSVIQKELEQVKLGKPGALGLGKEQLEEIVKAGEERRKSLEAGNNNAQE